MATRSRIGLVRPDGKVVSIYCHWDGYPSNNGLILLEHYTDAAKVESLISLGDISSLRPKVDPDPVGGIIEYIDNDFKRRTKNAKGVHTFDNPQSDVVVAYGRDRGENPDHIKPRIDNSVEDFTFSDVEEWGYLFDNGKWFVIENNENGVRRLPLTMEYCQANG